MNARDRLAALADIDDVPEKPLLSALDDMVLPLPVAPARGPVAVQQEEVGGASEELESLAPLALGKWREILEHPTDFEDLKLVQLQAQTAANVITATLKVDEGRLKRRKLDILPRLLDIISKEERGMVLEHAH